YGFVVVTGHGVDAKQLSQLSKLAKTFFAQPSEVKEQIAVDGGYGSGAGYNRLGKENVEATLGESDRNMAADYVESLVFHNYGWPPDPEVPLEGNFNEVIKTYCASVTELVRGMMQLTAHSLGAPPTFFDEHYEGLKFDGFLKLSWYPKQDPKPSPGQIRYGSHTDYQCLTVLKVEDVPGLQVQIGGEWVSVPYIEGAFIINVGDTLRRWTNGILSSNLHRVVNPESQSDDGRLSIVFFTGPHSDTPIIPYEGWIKKGETAKHSPITAGEYLDIKISRSQTNPDSTG
ncbi:hypothetical protein SARC_10324, partial [Sphaeroforma arctica JP610]